MVALSLRCLADVLDKALFSEYSLREIGTLENPVAFQPGDYLAHGIEGEEWPIALEKFKEFYNRIDNEEPDEEGFITYRPPPHILHVFLNFIIGA